MIIQCRFCNHTENGQLKIHEHEMAVHTKEFWLDRADRLERNALKDIEKAKLLREKYQ